MTKDPITLERIKQMHPSLVAETNALYDEIAAALSGRAICRFAYTYRSYAEQDALYAIGRTKPGRKVTNAKGGQSYHNFGLAFDIVLLRDLDKNGTFETASWETNVDIDGDGRADWMEIVDIAKRRGWEWGGEWRFKDDPHFQKSFGLSVSILAQKVSEGKTAKPGSTYPVL